MLDLDLLAYTIQQGRDHGLPGYSSFRNLCGLIEAHTFDQLNKTMTEDKLDLLRSLYRSPAEVSGGTGRQSEWWVAKRATHERDTVLQVTECQPASSDNCR